MKSLDDVLVALGSQLTRDGYGEEVRWATHNAFPQGVKRTTRRKLYLLALLRCLAYSRRVGWSVDRVAAFDR